MAQRKVGNEKSGIFRIGAAVLWNWMGMSIHGTVLEIHVKPVSKEIKGKLIKRNGSEDSPAYLVQSNSGKFALKLQTELQMEELNKTSSSRPTMFCS